MYEEYAVGGNRRDGGVGFVVGYRIARVCKCLRGVDCSNLNFFVEEVVFLCCLR